MSPYLFFLVVKVMKFNVNYYKNQESRKGKRPKQSSREKDKGLFKDKKIKCFNYGSLGHFIFYCSSPKDIKKLM